MRRLNLLTGVIFLGLLLISCSLTPVENAIEAMNRHITTLERESTAWREMLRATVDDLERFGQTTLATEVQNVLDRSIASASENLVRCNIDFFRDRTLDVLYAVRARLTGKQAPVSAPRVCSWSPPQIDLYLEAERRTSLQISGYDLNNKAAGGRELKLVLVNQDGSNKDKTEFLSLVTFYAAVVNTGGNGIQFDDQSKALRLFWGEHQLSEVPVIMPVIERRIVPIRPEPRKFVPPHTRGNKDFSGRVVVRANAWLEIVDSGQRLVLRVYMAATEPKKDYTTAEGTSPADISWTLYTAEPGTKITRVMTAVEDRLEFVPKRDDHSIHYVKPSEYIRDLNNMAKISWLRNALKARAQANSNNGLVREWQIIADTKGDEAGIYTSITPLCSEIQIEIEKRR